MERRYYPAQIEGHEGAYGVWFVDFPGCVSAGKTMREALQGAEEALALHITGMIEDGEDIPQPSEAEPKKGAVAVGVVPATMPGRKRRVNVTLDEGVLAAIDAIADNRSDFLERAARRELAA
ncbi:MAG TPA: type II toxin-antitoxin system HicB family antitoxin [Chthoniobacteraceae bacterium]|jgi:predicted RNase H-like HicB family nuclease